MAAANQEQGPRLEQAYESFATANPPPARPKRPLTPYNIFFQHERRKLLAATTTAKGIGFGGMARTVAARWKTTSKGERQQFVDLSIADRARYDDEMVVWKHRLRQHDKAERKKSKSIATQAKKERHLEEEKDNGEKKEPADESQETRVGGREVTSSGASPTLSQPHRSISFEEPTPFWSNPSLSPALSATVRSPRMSEVYLPPRVQQEHQQQDHHSELFFLAGADSSNSIASTLFSEVLGSCGGEKGLEISDSNTAAPTCSEEDGHPYMVKTLQPNQVFLLLQGSQTTSDYHAEATRSPPSRPVLLLDALADALGDDGVDFVINLFA